MASVIQELYDSEINVVIASFWDEGFHVRLGDRLNGFRAEARLADWPAVERWLTEAAIAHYPESAFAKRRVV